MRLLGKLKHHSLPEVLGDRIFERRASRAIVLNGESILLLYTKKYNDYSLPGGGVDAHEDLRQGLLRELAEETGASGIKIIKEFGYIDEIRPHHKLEYDYIHMLSYFYVCEIDSNLGQAQMEHYEIANGMEVKWVNIFEAIVHNKEVLKSNHASIGVSIERETLVLELVVQELILTV